MMMLFTIYIAMVLLLRVMSEVPYFTLIPLVVFPMLISLLISRRVALLLNCFVSIIGCFVFNGDVEFLLYFLLTGEFAALITRYAEKRKYVFPGAFVSLLSWLAFSIGFAYYVDNMANYSVVYGSIGAIIILLMWFYFSAITILMGAECNHALLSVYGKKEKECSPIGQHPHPGI